MFQGPSASMGRPEDTRDYSVFQADDITVFVEKRILDQYLEDGKITFHLDQSGKFDLIICDN
ncbi:MAG TPA: hypothetical protein PK684_04100 [Bacillota bacterium]|nr:hypothetical protein [Bacillota bacterium]